MGGRLIVHLDSVDSTEEAAAQAHAAARRVAARIDRWAGKLTRHDETSDLCRLNADPGESILVRPTLAASLAASRDAIEAGRGLVDITLLDARLAAETDRMGVDPPVGAGSRSWSLAAAPRGTAVVTRPAGVRFDLGGVGKGWIADRALRLLARFPSAVVDADGDLAIRCASGRTWNLGIDDPRTQDGELAVLTIGSRGAPGSTTWGVATSGTSVHRWTVDGSIRHHLIDPRTGAPARTDVVQATVIAGSALRAETYAKAAVIAGSVAGFALLDRAPIRGAVLLLEDGRVLALPQTLSLLAA
jgi:thiamine biosynthesis lipoprotein